MQAKRRERQESEAAIGMGPAADPASARSTLAPLVPLDSTPQLDENGRPIQQPRPGLVRCGCLRPRVAQTPVTAMLVRTWVLHRLTVQQWTCAGSLLM